MKESQKPLQSSLKSHTSWIRDLHVRALGIYKALANMVIGERRVPLVGASVSVM
jgi:hypothetical protein